MSRQDMVDVIVVGGGSSGVAAAVAAARCGARTALVEQAGCLGGAATIRNVLTYCGLYTLGDQTRQAVGGVASELHGKLRRLDAVTPRHRGVFVIFDPEAVKRSLDELCAEAIRRAMRRGYAVRLSGLSCGEGKNAMTKREADTCTDERVAYNEAKELE